MSLARKEFLMSKKSAPVVAGKKKSTYKPAAIVQRAKFLSGDDSQMLLLTLSKTLAGKFNLKASHKLTAEGSPEAETGCRQSFVDASAAGAAFETLSKEAAARGWKVVRSRSSFSSIPQAPAAAAAPKANGKK
jgi:hypothetical protein